MTLKKVWPYLEQEVDSNKNKKNCVKRNKVKIYP